MSIGGFAANSRLPVDTYNLDSVEISRGANSNLFGVGNASGTVNLNQSQGNLSRSSSQLSLRGDNWGGVRASVNFNRPIIKNKLALYVATLRDSKGWCCRAAPAKSSANTGTGALVRPPERVAAAQGLRGTWRQAPLVAVLHRPHRPLPVTNAGRPATHRARVAPFNA